MDNKEYKHIFFDLDRTLWDFDTNSKLALQEIHHTHLKAYSVSFEEFYPAYKSINQYYWGLYRKGILEKSVLRSIRFGKTLERFGIFDNNLAMILGSDYIRISPHKTKLIEGTEEVVDYLANKNYVLHIITNGFEEVQHIKLNNSGLKPYFDQIIISEKIGFKKPDIRVFEHALKISKTSKEESIMVGDDLAADILGAKNAGWDQIYYNPRAEDHPHDLTKEITNLKQIKEFL